LKKRYSKTLNKELGTNLNRSIQSISFMALKFGLKKDYHFYCKSRKKYNKEFTKEIFEKLYLKKGKSVREIALKLKLGKNTVDYYLKKFKIPKKNSSEAGKLSFIKYGNWKIGLRKETDERIKLASEKQKKTVALKRDQKLKKLEERFRKPVKELIEILYWKKGLTQEKIAKKLRLSRDLIIKLMKNFNISKRPNFDIIIECDGDYWHTNPKIYDYKKLDSRQRKNLQRDKFKNKYLRKKGWKVFRFFESDINGSAEKCVNGIAKEIKRQLKSIKTL